MQPQIEQSNQREQEILRELRLAGGSCRVGFLAERLNVSDETIRRNIKFLVAKSLVSKVHGGVLLTEELILPEQSYKERLGKNANAKQLLAAKVAEIISDGDSVFLELGSTSVYAAQALKNHKNLYVVTNSLAVANTLATRNNNRVFLAGGELRPDNGGSLSIETLKFVRQFNVQFAIHSLDAVDAEIGFMLHDPIEAELMFEVTRRAQTKILLADSEKFGRRAPIIVEDPSVFDLLITDTHPSADIADMLARNDIALMDPSQQ